MSLKKDLNTDQLRVIEILALNFFNKSSDYLVSMDNGIVGLPYKKIMEAADLSLEKTLLSLGALEAKGIVKHDVGIRRQMVEYLGHSNVEIAGQKVVRMFSLTEKGQNFLRSFSFDS